MVAKPRYCASRSDSHVRCVSCRYRFQHTVPKYGWFILEQLELGSLDHAGGVYVRRLLPVDFADLLSPQVSLEQEEPLVVLQRVQALVD